MRPSLGRDSPYRELASGHPEDDPALASVPAEAARTIRAAGLGPWVARALAGARAGGLPSLELLLTRQELDMRLISLETQLSAVIFEAECTGELIEAMSFELEDLEDLRELRLALGSLVVGAVAATAAGVWDLVDGEATGPAILGLAGGLGSASLGGAAFLERSLSMTYDHPRNLLAPVLEGRDHDELFPHFVFALLSAPAADGAPSPRERLLQRWSALIAEEVEPDARARTRALLFGAGGVYSKELLQLRERLYDALESELNAQARDLELLDRFLVRALERAPR